jgi:membrane protein implicated in regulation of membrane protease activity
MSAAFLFYIICFGVGLLFTLISAIGAHVFGGHSDLGHGFDHGHSGGHGGHAQGHAEGGGDAHDMPGFAPLSPTTIATFITSFGGFGMIFSQLAATRSPWLSAPLAAAAGFVIAFLVFLLFSAIFRNTQGTSEGRVADLIGSEATVITPVAADGVGEIAYVQSGSRYSAPARSDDGLAHASGAPVKITRIVGTQFYVASA